MTRSICFLFNLPNVSGENIKQNIVIAETRVDFCCSKLHYLAAHLSNHFKLKINHQGQKKILEEFKSQESLTDRRTETIIIVIIVTGDNMP